MNSTFLLSLILGLPLSIFLLLGASWLVDLPICEKLIGRSIKVAYGLMLLAFFCLLYLVYQAPSHALHVSFGDWFKVGSYVYPLSFQMDALTMPFVGLTIVLTGLVGSFSITYLHRDPGFLRFFLLLLLFSFGALLVFSASSLDLLIGGWELVGITSVLLISFFQYRTEPVQNALRVFVSYRVADLFILVAVLFAHHWYGSTEWLHITDPQVAQALNQTAPYAAPVLAILLVFAASGKSSQGPFCGWLPRAMEGPTPSSAIFYGAISVHAGPYLLLRVEPLLRQSNLAIGLLIFIGATTAFVATMIQRSSTDAKTSLAYASQTQLGIIFIEIALGWETLALIHVMGHATVRAMQFLRSPSMLSDYHRIHSGSGGKLDATGAHYDVLFPTRVQRALYCFTLHRGFYDEHIDFFVFMPLRKITRLLKKLEGKRS
jgi:NADH-quinone oxidoreductase subunit L